MRRTVTLKTSRFLSKFAPIFVAAVAACAVQSVKADIITTEISGPVAVAGGYAFTYDAELSFNSAAATGSAFPIFGTVYDIGIAPLAVTNVTGDLANSFTFAQAKTNAAAYLSTPVDSSSLYNLRFTYTGRGTLEGTPVTYTIPGTATTLTIGTNLYDLGQFTIVSPNNTTTTASYDGQSVAAVGSSAGLEQGNVGTTIVPTSAVPEPTTFAGIAIAGVSLLARKRRSI